MLFGGSLIFFQILMSKKSITVVCLPVANTAKNLRIQNKQLTLSKWERDEVVRLYEQKQ